MIQTTSSRGFSRRSFIKGVAAVTAAGALAGCTPKEDDKQQVDPSEVIETKIVPTCCLSSCNNGCALNAHVRDGVLYRTSARELPNPEYNRICSKGLSHPARVYSPERLQYPMRRVGERGSGEFERITWEEAISEISAKWKEITDAYGPSAMAWTKGAGNTGLLNGQGGTSVYDRFMNVVGASNINQDADLAASPGLGAVLGGMTRIGFQNEPAEWKNSKTIVCWGAGPHVSPIHNMHFLLEAKDAGTKYIVIDIAYNANAAKADWFIPINPGTDGALAVGVLNELFAQGWEDLEFLQLHSEAPLLIKEDGSILRMSDLDAEVDEAVAGLPVVWDDAVDGAVSLFEAASPRLEGVGEVGGIKVTTQLEVIKKYVSDFTTEEASRITGVPVEDIRELARIYGQEGPVNTYSQYGLNHYMNGHYNYRCVGTLAAASGNIGKRGAAVGYVNTIPQFFQNVALNTPVDAEGNSVSPGNPVYRMNQMNEIVETGMIAGQPAVVKGLWVAFANIVATFSQRDETLKWLDEMELIVVPDVVMSETARYADYVLPVSHYFEYFDASMTYYNHPFALMHDKAIEPLFESKSDFEILMLMADALGYGEHFQMTGEEFLAEALNTDAARELGLTFDRLKEEKAVRMLPGDEWVAFDGFGFYTSTGRASFYTENPQPDYNSGQELDPSKEKTIYWEPAAEATPGTPAREKHPFSVLSEHMRTRTHTQFWDVGCLKEYEPEPLVRINPEDAGEYGIAEGDMVRLFNDRGSVTLKATLSAGMPRKALGCPRSYQDFEFVEGHFASLNTNEYNQYNANQVFNDVAVSIEKA